MVTLRLFHQTNPFKQIDSRDLAEGCDLAIGREPGQGWAIEDPERELSRLHCVIEHRQGRLVLRDLSANGVFVGAQRTRPSAGESFPLAMGETFRLGRFLVVAEGAAAAAEPRASAFDDLFHQPLLRPVEIEPEALAIPTEWMGSAPAPAPPAAGYAPAGDGALLEAFCAGARLDASAFSGEDPAEVMRRLGAVYQQMVLGLADLMNERTSIKTEYRLERTTVRAEGNNPFRWAPTGSRPSGGATDPPPPWTASAPKRWRARSPAAPSWPTRAGRPGASTDGCTPNSAAKPGTIPTAPSTANSAPATASGCRSSTP
jgi:predicted component of type VI protein secretion system